MSSTGQLDGKIPDGSDLQKIVDSVKAYPLTNLTFLMNSISNLESYITNFSYHMNNLNSIKERISDSNKVIVTPEDIEKIDEVTLELFSKDLAKKVFRQHVNLSDKLEKLWIILQEIYEYDPKRVVECVENLIEKKIPKNMTTEEEKIEFRNNQLAKFLGTSKKVNTFTDFIFEGVKKDFQEHKPDALTICGMLLSFVANSQTHLYFAMESIKEAVAIVGKDHNLEEIFSLESPVMQGKNPVTDIRAIRNAVSHGSFNIEFNMEKREYVIDFQSTLTDYSFNKRYTGDQLLALYAAYDNLRNFQELLIRIILLKAQLKIFFVR
jgi:hypothetical protein